MTSGWNDWTTPSMLIAIAGVVVAIAGVAVSTWIALRLQHGSSQLAHESNRIFTHIRDLTSSIQEVTKLGRRDEIYRSLQTVRDPDLLHWYVTEGRGLTPEGTERVAMERFYYANPATPLVTEESLAADKIPIALHKNIVQAAVTSLPHRYRVPQDYWESVQLRKDLAALLPLAYRIQEADAGTVSSEASAFERVFTFIRTLLLEGWDLSVNNIKPLVTPWQPDIAKNFLFIIKAHEIPKPIFTRILTAISWHVLDEIYPLADSGVKPDNKHHTLLHAYASILHEGYIKEIGTWTTSEKNEDSIFECIGSTANAIGILAHPGPPDQSTASHVTRNLIVDLTEALQSFEHIEMKNLSAGMRQLTTGIGYLKIKYPKKDVIKPLVEAANILLTRSHLGPLDHE
ncbi:hypothetical protein PP404_06325 [Mycobacteroides abscessus]|nr:hypothetical protein [Mycobacteroides abscessus]MDM2176018.1 hypothetical protein [Mycobacteroides abscessus]MDM2207084.1 hypothetical protein [Mycobacteroides abscessus]MDM2210178.1 hypothetical protein [Mycobacteroides abscessus]MDM2217360.1 hypothetical protein [Mycobacteroides abscessus]